MKKILFLLILCISLTSCLTAKRYHTAQENDVQVQSSDGVTVSCRFVSEGELEDKYGTVNNPFTSKRFALTPLYCMVFEVEIKNETGLTLRYDSREVDLFFGEKSSRPAGELDMEDKIDNDGDNSGTERHRQLRLFKKTCYPVVMTLDPGKTVKKYVLFINNFRERGECTLQLPILYAGGSVADEFSFTYNIEKKRK